MNSPNNCYHQISNSQFLKKEEYIIWATGDEHYLETYRGFHGMDDAKEIWEAIRTRFGGNANSKKMQKAVFKQQFKAFKISKSEGLEKGYDRNGHPLQIAMIAIRMKSSIRKQERRVRVDGKTPVLLLTKKALSASMSSYWSLLLENVQQSGSTRWKEEEDSSISTSKAGKQEDESDGFLLTMMIGNVQ
ncbi:hypothetical protein Tco_1500209 [Tanacetum coccineum]